MKLVNSDKITHIKIFKEIEGFYSNYRGLLILKYLPFKKGFLFFSEDKEEGFYENGKYDGFFSKFLAMDEID